MNILQEILYVELKKYNQNYQAIQENNKIFVTNINNIFNQIVSYSSQDKLIHIPFNSAADQFVRFGILPAIDIYREMHLEDKDFNDIDNEFLKIFDKEILKLKQIWIDQHDNQAFKTRQLETNEKMVKKKHTQGTISIQTFQNQNQYNYDHFTFFELMKESLKLYIVELNQSDRGKLIFQSTLPPPQIEKLDMVWEKLSSWNIDLINQEIIENQKQQETYQLIVLLVKIREHSVDDFKKNIQNFVNLLTDNNTVNIIKKQVVIILRELSNFKAIEEQGQGIRNDLCQLGFTKFLCQIISSDKTTEDDKLEYIHTLIDFLDEGFIVQQSVLDYMLQDENNYFIFAIKDYIEINFQDFVQYESGLQSTTSIKIFEELRQAISKKIYYCTQGIWIFKMVSEGHFSQMQNFLREQIINGQTIVNNCNVIQFTVKLFGIYSKMLNEENVQFGEKLFDFLIEIIQGPCQSNQIMLCESKILENLEDLMFELLEDEVLKIFHFKLVPFTKRIFIFILSLFEGNTSSLIINKIDNHLHPSLLLRRLKFIYKYIIKQEKLSIYQQILDLQLMKNQEDNDEDNNNHTFVKQKSYVSHNMSVKTPKTKNSNYSRQETQTDDIINFFLNMKLFENDKSDLQKIEQEYEPYINDLKEEGQLIYILIKNFKIQSSNFRESFKKATDKFKIKLQKDQNELQILEKTLLYYKINTARIEIINNDNLLQYLFFPIPEMSKYLKESSKEQFLENVNRQFPTDKINGLLNIKQDFIDEMNHQQFLATNIPFDLDKIFKFCRYQALLNALIINLVMLLDSYLEECYECRGLDPHLNPCVCSPQTPTKLGIIIDINGLLLTIINILSFMLWAVLKFKLDLLKAFNQFRLSVIQNDKILRTKQSSNPQLLNMSREMRNTTEYMQKLYQENVEKYIFVAKYLAFNSYFVYLSVFAILTILGQFLDKLFYTFLLLDIIQKSDILQVIVGSVTQNIDQLISVANLMVIMLFIYSVFSYYVPALHETWIGADISVPLCTNPFNCFLVVLNNGLRAGGGVGEILTQPDSAILDSYFYRFFVDISFYLIITIVMLSVVFAIIYDTFYSLNLDISIKDEDKQNKCFICSLERSLFDQQAIFFEKHTYKEHNLWNYFFYMFYLYEKDQQDYNGTESDIQSKIDKYDLTWFPIGQAKSLSQQEKQNEEISTSEQLKIIEKNLENILELVDDKEEI